MTSNQNRADSTQRKLLPHFKSTNYLDTNSHSNKLKVKRDMSTISNYCINTQRKNSEHVTFNKTDSKNIIIDGLPDIHSKHRSQKRSSFLEMWLEEALDPTDTTAKVETKTVEVQKTGPLRTVEKFQIDKKYLKSQNITGEVIDKLYNSLYVYTYGINNTFSEILALTKTSEHASKKIINSFWKAFIKLLEGCTSYRTAFQVIEQSYQKQMTEVRDIFAVKQASFIEERKHFEQEIVKLNKKISEQSYSISKLTNDYNIAESTLHLTDQAFNEEVNLRLKFEEKVNAVFTSYEEIKMKYDKLIMDLQLKGEEELSTRQIEVNLRARLEQAEISNSELKRQISRVTEIVKEREDEIQVKQQEIYELTATVTEFSEKKDENEEDVRRIIVKLDHFRQINENQANEIDIKSNLIKEYQNRIREQQKLIDNARAANEKVYQKYESTGKLLGDFNAERIVLINQTQSAEAEALTSKAEKEAIQAEKEIFEKQCKEYEHLISDLTLELSTKNTFIQRNTELIRNLQAVKDKFERLYTITSTEKRKMEEIMNEAVRTKEIFEEEMVGMKMLLQNRNTELDEANNKLENEREVFRSKISSLRQEVATKESQILEFHNKQLEDQSVVTEATQKLKEAESSLNRFTEEIMKIQSDLLQKELLLKEASTQREKNRQIFKDLNCKLQEISRQQIDCELNLSSKKSLLEQIRGKADKEKELLRKLLESYREDREKKVAYIHPMLYEDCRMQIDRSTHKIEDLNQRIASLEKNVQTLNQTIELHMENIGILKNGLLRSQAENEKKKEIIELLEKDKKELEGQVAFRMKKSIESEGIFKQKSIKYESTIQQQATHIAQLGQQLSLCKKTIQSQREAYEKLQDQRKIQNIHHMAQEDELNNVKAQVTRLKEQLSSFKRGDSKNSSRTQALKRKTTLNQQKDSSKITEKERDISSSKNQQRERVSSSKHEQTYRSQEYSLKPIEQQSQIRQNNAQKNKRVENKEIEVEVRPHTVERQSQTQKDKSKFTHSFKFQQVPATSQSFGCQVQIIPTPPQQQYQNSNQVSSLSAYKSGRIQGEQFKRALKLTYMRR